MKKNYAKSALIVCYGVVLGLAFFFHSKWKSSYTEATLSWDVSGYYMYLPATFIYKDLKKCAFIPQIIEKYHPTPDIQQGYWHEPSGNFVMKYASGQAILMAPFFAVGHMMALSLDDYDADGFSYPYQISIGIGMLIYSILGIYFLCIILMRYFSDIVSFIVLLSIVIGSNYLLFASVDQSMTHSPLFFLYALLLYLVDQFYKKPYLSAAIYIGVVTGLMTLIRPTEFIAMMIPIFWAIGTKEDFKKRVFFLYKDWKYALAVGFVFILIVSIQPIYWKYVTGEWIVYSYQDQGFSWLKPHFKDYTFSFSSGWLMYAPIMVFAFIGIPFTIYRLKNHVIWIFFLIAYFIVCAWD
ncbi:MAG TPA: hypothetical protein PKD85_15320, partial [Saprospiraceae bacterium]|nr:hypothetical protein [Saprospiraceae bacterium]